MFPFEQQLIAAVEATPQTIADVVQLLEKIESICVDGDGLKWFNWLYLQVTRAVEGRVNASGPTNPDSFTSPAWIAALDLGYGVRPCRRRGGLDRDCLRDHLEQ